MKLRIHLALLSFFLLIIFSGILEAQSFTGTMNSFHKYDMDKDGTYEIDGLKYLPFDAKSANPSSKEPLVLVLVEDRLMLDLNGSKYTAGDLEASLLQYKQDLKLDGYESRFVETSIYRGAKHQDGLTLLAIREWLRAIDKDWNLSAVVLVGRYPDAMLVRRWIWRKVDKDITINGKEQKGVDYLRIVPEIVSDRSDLVLADLDGKWENIYEKEKTNLEFIEALPDSDIGDDWPLDDKIFVSSSFNMGHMKFEDFFWINDSDYIKTEAPSSYLKLSLKSKLRGYEVSATDRLEPNVIARPEILVSRINPYHIAVEYKLPGTIADGFLDQNGKPRVYSSSQKVSPNQYIRRQPSFERSLLIEYFERNHEFRAGKFTETYRNVASISHGKGVDNAPDLLKYLREAIQNPQNSFLRKDANLVDYIAFLQYDATLKGVVAHSSATSTSFGKAPDLSYLHQQLGGHLYRWEEKQQGGGYVYTPTLYGVEGLADAYFHRTVYENKILKNSNPCFYIHMGCQVNSPQRFQDVPYSRAYYSNRTGEQNSESILFFTEGLAIASRAKVFNDRPNGFTEELGSSLSKPFGAGLIAYFEKEAQNAALATNYSQCKRPYTWSIQGDGLLKLRYETKKGGK